MAKSQWQNPAWNRKTKRGVMKLEGGYCAECGTHILTRRPGLPAVILKVGTFDDPSVFGAPEMAIYTVDKQAFHQIPGDLPTFERLPKR
ncbi:MAG TPA: GFA family protein [Terriglobales bacterium]|nr:GFA family protein [Terriglobales bacterium]